jgi:phage gpG-like protein
MADVEFVVDNWRARRYAIQPNIQEMGAKVAAAASAASPRRTGRLAGSFHTVPGQDPGTVLIVSDVPYARFHEYGTRHIRARAMLGRALAAAG